MSWAITYRDGSGSACDPVDIDESAKRRIAIEIQQGHSYGSLGEDDFYAPTTKEDRVAKSNLEAMRKLSDEELAMCLMCPYDFSSEAKDDGRCDQFTSCQQCTLNWLLQDYDETHAWFNKEE